jgi:hypothetical protein
MTEWTCFHCDETFTTPEAARHHFGEDETRDPACIINGDVGLVTALRKSESRNGRLEGRIEVLECTVQALRNGYRRLGGANDEYTAFCNYDTMEGRAIAAEALIAEIQSRWPALVDASRRRASLGIAETLKEHLRETRASKIRNYLEIRDNRLQAGDTCRDTHKGCERALRDVYLIACGEDVTP